MSGIFPGIVESDDSPKRRRTNDEFSQFIKQYLINQNFCVKTSARNDNVAKRLGPPSSKPPAQKHRGSSRVLHIESAWETLHTVLKSKTENPIYKPLCKFLTLLANKKFLFIPWDHKTAGEDELYRQDIITVNARPEEIDRFLNANQKMDKLPSEFTYCEGNKLKPRIYYSDIQLVGEVKTGDAPDEPFNDAVQVLKCLFNVSRYQPQHAYHIGILVYRDGFFIIDYYPDQVSFSKLFKWADKDATWEALRSAIASVRKRRFTTQQFSLIKPSYDQGSSRLQYSLSGDFNTSEAQVYRLFDLHRGYGYHRNAYVALGVRSNVNEGLDPDDWKVIKHYWHDMGRCFDELEIFKKIYSQSETKRCTAGIVQVDLQESRELGQDSTPTEDDQSVKRQSILIIMKTLGKTLATCSSVMKFLKVMYDLVEVHRMLVEEHNVLHRDISWTNVLIDAIHVDGDKHDDLCGRPFIDAILDVEEKERKVHATLSDFDCASILGSDKQNESDTRGQITGTPMFMSRQLCLFPSALRTLHKDFQDACKDVFPQGVTGVNQRQEEVAAFLHAVNQFNIVRSVGGINTPQKSMVHEPMHDAESIFWLIVFFFLRAWPKGYDPQSDPNEHARRKLRTWTLQALARNQIGTAQDTRGFAGEYILPPQLLSFSDMLDHLNYYFLQRWHCLGTKEEHRFHAHNALQSVLLQEIKKMQAYNTEIEINLTPLGVNDNPVLILPSQSYVGVKRSAPDDATDYLKVKKQKVEHFTNGAVGKVGNKLEVTSSDSLSPALAPLMSALDGGRRSKLWFTGDEDYKEHAFVEAGYVAGLIRTSVRT